MPSCRRALRSLFVLLGLGAHDAGATSLTSNVAAPSAMTLSEALVFARAHHPGMAALRARAAAARLATEVPRARWLPRVALGLELLAGTTNNTTASYLPMPGIGLPRIGATPATNGGDWKPDPSTVAAIGVAQPLFDFGRTSALTALSDAIARAERFRADSERMIIELTVAQSYFAVLASHEIVSASDQAYERALVHRDDARAKVAVGLRSLVDLTRAEADLARYDVGRARARGGLDVARYAFAAAVGVAAPSLDASGTPPPLPPLPTLEVVLQAVRRNHPDLAARVAELEVARSETRSVEAEGHPDAWLSASLSGREGGAAPSSGSSARYGGWVPSVPNWDAALIVSWPFFDGVRAARKRLALGKEQIAAAEVTVTDAQLLASARQTYAEVALAASSLVALEQASEAARANYAQAEARFKGGLATAVELADAEALRIRGEIDVAIGRFELFRTRAALAQLTAESP